VPKVADAPLQIAPAPVSVGVSTALTTTVAVAVAVQFWALLTVTVYVVVADGFCTKTAIVAPVFHKYDVPPLAVKVAADPGHIAPPPAIDAAGTAPTEIVALAVALHPLASVAVTVYVAVAAGAGEIEVVVAPVLHK
jgi:hypothetical protein